MKYTIILAICGMVAATFLSSMLYAQNQASNIQSSEPQAESKSSLDILLSNLKQQRESRSVLSDQLLDRDGQVLRLQSELIDLRVERDRLAMQVNQLATRLQEVTVIGASTRCRSEDCVPVHVMEEEKVSIQISNATKLFKYGRDLYNIASCDQTKEAAQTMMQVAIDDLELLGFDTTDLLANKPTEKEAHQR